jgi:histone acetyltransferase 1
MQRKDVAELTVEDPMESFEDLRDKNDLIMLLSHKQFMKEAFASDIANDSMPYNLQGQIGPPADRAWAEKWRKDLKLADVGALHYVIEIMD